MTTPDQVHFTSLEQVIAADFNRMGGLAGKAILDAFVDLEAGADLATTAPRSRVLRGLDLSVGAGLQVLVAPGSLVKHDATATGTDQSLYAFGRLTAQAAVSLDAADATHPRFDLIHATVGSATADSTSRQQLVLPGRTVGAVSLPKSRRGTLTIGKVTGVAGASPALPAIPAGSVAIGYVLVPANAVAVDNARLLDARDRFASWPLSRSHEVRTGCVYDPTTGTLYAGSAAVDGTPIEIPTTVYGVAGGWGANLEHHLYLVAPSPTTPVSKTTAAALIITTTAPNAAGKPNVATTYLPNPADSIAISTQRALYIGTIMVDDTGAIVPGITVPTSRDGLQRSAIVDASTGGVFGGPTTWFKVATPTWVDATTLSLADGNGLIKGEPFRVAARTVTMAANMAVGAVEAPSTWYYVYFRTIRPRSAITRSSAARALVAVISPSAPDALGGITTPEAGFTSGDYIFVGSVYNNASSNILEFARSGWQTRWLGSSSAAPFQLWNNDLTAPDVAQAMTALVPNLPNGSLALIELGTELSVESGVVGVEIFAYSGSGGSAKEVWRAIGYFAGYTGNAEGAIDVLAVQLEIPVNGAGAFSMRRNTFSPTGPGAAINLRIASRGFVESVF